MAATSLRRFLLVAIGIAAMAALAWKLTPKPQPPTTPPSTFRAATQPVESLASTRALPQTRPLQTYIDVLADRFPDFPATRPYPLAVDLADAAHLVLHEPIYLGPIGDLWLTTPNAEPLETVLARAAKETEHIVPVPVDYARWTVSRSGRPSVAVVCRGQDENTFELISATQRRPLPRHAYHWDRAMSWDDGPATRIIVPTNDGVSVLTIDGPTIHDDFHPLISAATTRPYAGPPPCVLFDLRGIITWMPADAADAVPSNPARFVDGHWLDLNPTDFGNRILHIIPTLDGGALAINRGEGDVVDFRLAALDATTFDTADVKKQIDLMDDPDSQARESAYDRLTQYGPAIFPLLQKQLDANPSPEVESRLRALLAGKIAPRLGGMQIHDNRLIVATRLHDGGVIFAAPAGISYLSPAGQQTDVDQAWLVVRPGRAVHLAPPFLTDALHRGADIYLLGDDEWIAADATGTFRLRPPALADPLTRKAEKMFTYPIGIDARGRWLLCPPADHLLTLILDPTVPDPKPRLVAWTLDLDGNVGWTADNWPAVDRNGLWLLKQSGWVSIAANSPEKLITELPADDPQTQPADKPLLTDPDGTRYFGGITDLSVTSPTGKKTAWPLPADAQGTADAKPWLVHIHDGGEQFFLLNSDGRLLRFKLQPDAAEMLKLEAAFTTAVPQLDRVTRMWLDPAGRIIIAYDQKHLIVFFPSGQVPPEISDQILPRDLHSSDDE